VGVFLLMALLPSSRAVAAPNPMLHNSFNLNSSNSRGYGNWGSTYTCNFPCHTPSSTTNIKKVATAIQTPTGSRPVVFNRVIAFSHNTSGVMGDDQRNYAVNNSTNVCEVCHHKTSYHQYSSSKL